MNEKKTSECVTRTLVFVTKQYFLSPINNLDSLPLFYSYFCLSQIMEMKKCRLEIFKKTITTLSFEL